MKNRNKLLIIFGVVIIVIALIVFFSVMFITGEIKPEYFISQPAIASYIMLTFALIIIGYVIAGDWIRRL